MELTPQLLAQIDFSEKFRGYDPEEVDAFLDRVIASVADLNNSLAEATERADRAEAELRAVNASAPVPRAPEAMSDEEEASQAMSTLLMAKRTADAAIADARREADKTVSRASEKAAEIESGAQTESERVLSQARRDAETLTVEANERAESEYSGQRERILAAIGTLETSRESKASQLAAIEVRIEDYRHALGHIHGTLTTLLEDPEAAIRPPIDGLDFGGTRQPVPQPSPAPVFEPEAERGPEHAPAPAAEEVHHQFSEAPPVAGAHVAPVAAVSIADQSSEQPWSTPQPWESAQAWDAAQPWDATQAAPSEAQHLTTEEPSSGAWGPGSWSDVPEVGLDTSDRAAVEEPQIAEHVVDMHATTSPEPEVGQVFNDFPSEGLPVIGQDRYTRDLDQAVNREGAAGDDAMTAFFEGDDETTGRRFGRRR